MSAQGLFEQPADATYQVGQHCWLVGRRNPASMLQCNTYLCTLGEGTSQRRICVDPGSQYDFPVINSNIQRLIGDLSEVDVITVNHQDPDVVGNAQAFCQANPNITAMMTEDVWRLVQHLAISPKRLQFANPIHSRTIQMATGHRWQVIPTPFCHFRGAMAFYDTTARILFSGDLFGGINPLGRVHLFAEQSNWDGIAQFHQIYMPSREVLRYAVRQIRAIDPPVEVIAPQHGYLIEGDRVPEFLDRMHELLVGHDLLALELDDTYFKKYCEVTLELVKWVQEMMGEVEVIDRLSKVHDDGLEQLVNIVGNDIRVRREGYSALAKIFARLSCNEPSEFVNAMRAMVLLMCSERGIPIPPIGVGVEGVPGS